ncbi:MAG: hypothetical protein EPO62_00415 [Candidatus Nitrosotenuis sp.]|nr:MAG: hypothetical protein EPO62_00415 [Candidatus Nitrosotenuis sp.]
MNKDNPSGKENAYYNHIIKIIKENEEFLNSNKKRKKIFSEISELMLDAIDYLQGRDFTKDPKAYFVFNALMPFSQGIYISILSGNIASSHMQLRLLIEYLALCAHAEKVDEEYILDKLEKTRKKFEKSVGGMVRSFDLNAFGLWSASSRWFHAKSHSRKIEKIVTHDKLKLWQIIQPAPYDKDDEKELTEFARNVKAFNNIINGYFNQQHK